MAKHIMTLTVNDDQYEFAVDDTDTLLDAVLRHLGETESF